MIKPSITAMTKRVALIFLLALTCLVQSQEYKEYDWLTNPALHEIAEEDKQHEEIILKYKVAFEVVNELASAYEYHLKHEITKVNSDKAVERNNRVYLPLSTNDDVLIINKARVITSKGEVKELDESDILEAVDETSRRTYKYYAIEGIDKGSEIEVLQLIKKDIGRYKGVPYWCGDNILLQKEVPVRNIDVEIIAPQGYELESLALNMDPLEKDTSLFDEKVCLKTHIEKIDPLIEEGQAVYFPNLKQVNYKIKKDKFGNDYFNYTELSKLFYKRLKESNSKKDLKAVKKIFKEIDLPESLNQEEQIRFIEDYVKLNYQLTPSRYGTQSITFLQKNKIGSEMAFNRLFAYLFDRLEIPYEFVYTSDRYRIRFEKDFEAWHFPSSSIFYFSSIDKYMEPGDIMARLGFIDYHFQGNLGLFVSHQKGYHEIREITPLPRDKTGEILNVSLKFNKDDLSTTTMDYSRSVRGYYSQTYQVFYDFADEETTKQIDEELINYLDGEVNILDYEILNKGAANFGKKPMVINSKLESSDFVQKAGPKYLFKIGDLIGPQMEMYQEKDRKLNIETGFTRTYERHIEVDVPVGYSLKNLDALKFSHEYKVNDEKSMVFTSDYKLENGKLVVDVLEYYEKIFYSKEIYEDYRTVINAAADFNKVTLVLEKK